MNIITVTFNPAIDKNTAIEKLSPEKKLRCSSPTFGAGGGGINVSRALKNLGKESVAVYPAGGHTGYFLNQLLKEAGIETSSVPVNHFTRENLIVFEESTGNQFRFGMPGNEITDSDSQKILSVISERNADMIIVSGSLLPGMPVDIIAELAKIAKNKNCKLVLDTSGEALKKALEVGVYLLKPNINELSTLVGEKQIEKEEVETVGKDIIKRGLCELLVVSMGEGGAKLITKDEIYNATAPQVEIVSTLGAGDSMVAGMVYALSQNYSLEEVLRYGIACGTAATITKGSELCRKDDVERLLTKVKVE